MKKLSVVALLSLFLALPVFAQEVTPEVTEEPVAVVIAEEDAAVLGTLPNPTEVEQNASTTLTENALFLAFAAPLVFALTALLKRVPFLTSVPSPQIGLVLNILIWVAYVVAKEYGGAEQFETVVGSLTAILGTFLGISLTTPAAGYLHSQAVKGKTPILGHQRTTPPL